MNTSTTLRSVMSILALALITTMTAPAANACDGKVSSPVKVVRPLSALKNAIKHLFGENGDSSKHEPSVDDGFIPDADTSDLPISG